LNDSQIGKAAILREIRSPLAIENIIIPKPKFGQVHVRFFYSSICRSQIMEIDGFRGEDKWLPHMLGHEGAGVVVAVGDGVTKVKVGDEVVASWIKTTGIDAMPASYFTLGKREKINAGQCVTFSTDAIISENKLFQKPKNIPMHLASLLGCALPTGAGIVLNLAKPSKDSKVVIVGLGGVGLSALISCIALEVKNIVVIDENDEKLKLAKQLGVLGTLNSKDPEHKKKLFHIWKMGADICIEAAGTVKTIEMAFSLINEFFGKLYFASHPKEGETISLVPHELIKGKQIFGSWGGGDTAENTSFKLSSLYNSGHLKLDCLVGDFFDLENINDAIEALRSGNDIRPVIRFNY